ncbi:MAG: L,D-transpeptidase family protein [Anaerovoracaceae bacterium]|jgi:lipoprotein-anchoring transpeptidase ErfK/SrfK
MNKKKKILTAVVCCVAAVAVGLTIYGHSEAYAEKASHFPQNTSINGIDCSELTVEEAAAKLTDTWQSRKVTVREDGSTVATYSLKNTEYSISEQLQDLIGSNFFSVMKNHAGSGEKSYKVSMKMKNSPAFDRKVKASPYLHRDYKTKTKNAYVELEDTKFTIIKEVYGDNVDADRVLKKLKSLVASGKFELDYSADKFYELPTVKKGDESLKEEQEFDKKHYSQKIVYTLYNGSYQIKPKDLKKMMPADDSGNVSVSKKGVNNFVKRLAWKVNTQYFNRKFKTTNSGTITVYGGSYGYALDKTKEAKQLTKDLKAGKDVKRKPKWAQEAYYTGTGKSDIGNSYIEVSISQQTLWLYKKGKCILSTAVTTGQSGHPTDPGCYFIEYKQLGATLTGQGYSSPVTYWMPFNGDQGCHDAPWRSDFGSGAYTSNGSHGCVNMPYYAAQELYNQIEKGYPVVIY